MGIYYKPDATDEEIAECFGDYYGCSVCMHQRKCLEMLRSKLVNALDESKEVDGEKIDITKEQKEEIESWLKATEEYKKEKARIEDEIRSVEN